MSWDPAIAIVKLPNQFSYATWSPCNQYIAISRHLGEGVQILDAVTLKQLKFLQSLNPPKPPRGRSCFPTFSPDSRTLTDFGGDSRLLTCWDLQTGVPVCKIIERPAGYICSTTYSECGTMLGILFRDERNYDIPFAIGTYNSHSGTPICYHPIEGSAVHRIWACDGCVQFATLDAWFITIWEVRFTSTDPPTQVRSLPTPHDFNPWGRFLFHPTPPRLAFGVKQTLFVWDVYHSKFLLEYTDFESGTQAFSSDGHFLICMAGVGEIYIWEELPTGYTLYQKLEFNKQRVDQLFLSPNGQSVVVSNSSTIQLLHTKDSTTSAPRVVPQLVDHNKHSILVFSQDGSLAVTTQVHSNTVTVLNLRSGLPCLNIDTGMPVYGVGVTRTVVAAVCDSKVITWNIPIEDCVYNTNVDINDSVQTISFHYPGDEKLYFASISPDFNHFVITAGGLRLYDMSTGKLLGGSNADNDVICFTSDSHEVWCFSYVCEWRWAVVQDSGSNVMGLKCLDPSGVPSGVLPWQSPHGCKVTKDGWILSSSGKRLLWLPHHWRLGERNQVWGGQFLAILDNSLPAVVILELPEE